MGTSFKFSRAPLGHGMMWQSAGSAAMVLLRRRACREHPAPLPCPNGPLLLSTCPYPYALHNAFDKDLMQSVQQPEEVSLYEAGSPADLKAKP